jgi:hypothetical protein
MLSRWSLILLLLLTCQSASAQNYGNEWIDYSQSYYSIKIVNDGIYRLDYNTLNAAGIPLSTFQTENIQMYGKEREIPLHIVDGGDSSFDPGDYLIFYAERNDGWLDSLLYEDPDKIGNPAYSLYNDTLQYFFTWNTSTNNLRYQVETDVNFGANPSIATHIMYTHEQNFNPAYYEGKKDVSEAASSFHSEGEGWASYHVNGASGGYTNTFSVPTPMPYIGTAPVSQFQGKSVSTSNAAASGANNHHTRWRLGGATTMMDTMYQGFKQIVCDYNFNTNLLTNGNTPIYWDIVDDLGAVTDYQAYNYISLKYPRIPDFGGSNNIKFQVIDDPQGKIRLDISNAGFSTPIMLVHGDTPMMVPFTVNGAVHSVLIPNSTNNVWQDVIYQDSSLIIDVTSLAPVNGTGTFTDFTAVPGAIEDALLFIYHDNLVTASTNYAAYRSSLAGGNYNVLMANIDELYQQFGGGIEKHIFGIRRFADYIHDNSTNKPVGLFLMGKGIREASSNSTGSDGLGTRKDITRFHECLIPSYGQPSSDVAITAGLDGVNRWVPLMATGRISARTDGELQGYLDKIVEFDLEQDPMSIYDTPTKDWQKHIIHFGGGSDYSQQQQYQGYLEQYEYVLEDSLFGGYVNRVYKTSSDPLDPTILAGVTDRIEQGVSLMTYFGHASATSSGFEINLDDPVNWNNTGKYPLMLVNSCYNGNIFNYSNSKSEEFVQVPNFGAIGYIASVAVGWDVYLHTYSLDLNRQFSRDSYGSTIGEQMKTVIENQEPPVGGTIHQESTLTQMVLNGDPMLRLNWHQNPEIELLAENVSFSPTDLNLTVDSIEMTIVLNNLGHSVMDTFALEIIRDFPGNSTDSVYNFVVPYLHFKDTFQFKMPLQPNIGIGINNFTITADIPSQVPEQYEEIFNNQIIKTLFIDIDGIVPVIPYEFAVVPEDSVTLKASTINPVADWNTYRFEIDTTDLFDSPEHRYAIVSGLGGVKEVDPSEWILTASGMNAPLTCTDSTVYFWRVAIDSAVLDWRESSFQYITGREGWGQDHFFQFKKNGFFAIDYDRPTRTRKFGPFTRQLTCDVRSSTAFPDFYYNSWYIDGTQMDYGICNFAPKLHVAVVDPVTLTEWRTATNAGCVTNDNPNPFFSFGNNNDMCSCASRSMGFFTFNQDDPAKLDAFQDMINNSVPDGHYLLIYSPMTTRYDLWNSLDSTDMYDLFTTLGSDSIHGGRPNTPFAFFCRKGDTSSVVELFAQTPTDDVFLEATLTGNDYEGRETSTLIGPAAQWGNVYWKQDSLEVGTADSTVLSIRAYDITQAYQYQIDTLFTPDDSILNLNGLIDATQYPFIDLSAYYNDTVTNTPAQIDRWHVLFQPVPEAAIDGSTQYTWEPGDTLEEGQTFDFAVDIRNIFTVDMDSLLVSYWVEDANQNKIPIPYPRQDSLLVGDTLRDTVTVPTLGLGGYNSLWVEVNPYINGSLYITDQPEQEHFNNLLQIPFFVNPDDKNPILDVTFNGNHILNGDIVDPNSEILITLKDDNEFLIMDNVPDTALFGVYLTDPLGIQTKIPFVNGLGETVMQWIPAEPQHKRFKIIWPSEFTMDGTYTLFVQGADRSGNLSGDMEYRVSFDIIHESTITHMMNYPNPFSTSTRFVFTLTGSEVPDDIIIQIMTVSGKVVREITEDELGLIQIGRNITEFAWDGTDEFGDPLANGVYLYRVKARINGESIKHRESGADTHFKKNFGKMYLMR